MLKAESGRGHVHVEGQFEITGKAFSSLAIFLTAIIWCTNMTTETSVHQDCSLDPALSTTQRTRNLLAEGQTCQVGVSQILFLLHPLIQECTENHCGLDVILK